MQNQNTHRFQLAGLEMQNQVSKLKIPAPEITPFGVTIRLLVNQYWL